VPAIPEAAYVPTDDGPIVTVDLIRRYHGAAGLRDFNRWFGVGTCPVRADGTVGIFLSDYYRWLDGLPQDD
jgi:hypothetical protein